MPKPTNLIEWATSGSALITEPVIAQKQAGFVPAEKPPAQFFNWLFNGFHQWIMYLNDFETFDHNWTGENVFQALTEFQQAIVFTATSNVTFASKPSMDLGLTSNDDIDLTATSSVNLIDGNVTTDSGNITTNSGAITTDTGDINTNSGDVNLGLGDINIAGSTAKIVLNPTAKIQHSAAILERSHVSLATLQPVVGSAPVFSILSAHGNQACWLSLSTLPTLLIGGDFRIPSKAQVTNIGFFCKNLDAVPRTMVVRLFISQHQVATITTAYWNPSAASGEAIIVAAGGAGWYEIAINDQLPDIASIGGDLCLAIDIPQTTTSSAFALCGIRAKYNFQAFDRSI